jgi:hypothetical protein
MNLDPPVNQPSTMRLELLKRQHDQAVRIRDEMMADIRQWSSEEEKSELAAWFSGEAK